MTIRIIEEAGKNRPPSHNPTPPATFNHLVILSYFTPKFLDELLASDFSLTLTKDLFSFSIITPTYF